MRHFFFFFLFFLSTGTIVSERVYVYLFWPRGRHLARWATGNIGRIIPMGSNQGIWTRFGKYSVSGRVPIYLTDKVTNDTLHHRCCDYYYYAINAINESRNCIDGRGWQGNLGYQLYTSIPFIHFLCVSLYVHSRVKFIACVIFLVF